MKTYKDIESWTHIIYCFVFGLIVSLCGPCTIQAQQEIALPSDGNFSSEQSPQGGLRYHRQLYLITADEMSDAGIQSGIDLNSIGFTIAEAQTRLR